jgi:hypothetical protein
MNKARDPGQTVGFENANLCATRFGLRSHETLLCSVEERPRHAGLHDGCVLGGLWDAATGQARLTFKGHEGPVTGVDFRPDGALPGSGGWDKTVRFWDGTPLSVEPIQAPLDRRGPDQGE